jgi:hypothetical protein
LDFGDGRGGEKEEGLGDGDVIALASSYACPVCAKDLSAVSLTNRQAHVSRCCGEKEREQQTDAEEKRGRQRQTAASQLLQKQDNNLVSSIRRTIEHNEKENSSLASNRSGNQTSTSKNDFRSEHYWCRLCRKDLSKNTYEQRVAHVKKCSRQSALKPAERETAPAASASLNNASSSGQLPSIVTWLQSLGLERYRETFLREEISLDLVTSLTDSDLMTLGVTSLGARRKILTSVCALPIPSTSLKREFAQLSSRNNSKNNRSAKNNRRITQYLGKKRPQQYPDPGDDGNQVATRPPPLIGLNPSKRTRKEEEQQITSGGGRTRTETTFGGSKNPSAAAVVVSTDIIGNSSLAICGNKKSMKSLWNYAGE